MHKRVNTIDYAFFHEEARKAKPLIWLTRAFDTAGEVSQQGTGCAINFTKADCLVFASGTSANQHEPAALPSQAGCSDRRRAAHSAQATQVEHVREATRARPPRGS